MNIFQILSDFLNIIKFIKRCFLTKQEREILYFSEDGMVWIFSSDQTGKFVRTKGKDFYFENEPEKNEKYLEALESLIKKNYVRFENGCLYKLTSRGLRKYRKLRKKKVNF